ncbi:serine/threonine-protein kinase-like protein GIN4 [Massariosphaeria phaeospora]|uniref:non-specific serine/threonine protein kinase n=1 Tax=Massariosphaeria phaeospora TaxID=100035 RepID=A0A7C8MEC0_9PLEO|nr:serine/threonine-protein kinase-like protein GIN4 [Massariosphaeria phaeospora]
MDHIYHGRPPTRRRALGDATLRANEDHRSQRPRGAKHSPTSVPSSSPRHLPPNESPASTRSRVVRHPPHQSPENKRLSAVINEGGRPRNSKRDSEISTTSTTSGGGGGRRKTHIGPWQLGKTIGQGGCSRVRVVRHSSTGQDAAAKIISKKIADKVRALSLANLVANAENDPTMFPGGKVIPFGLEREICIMKLLSHDNIVRLYDVWENRNELYLIMEYVKGGELFTYIGEQGGLDEHETVYIFRQIIAALLYCHRLNIHHRDLKPENILLDKETMTIKLVDFGMAALQPAGKLLTTPCGSPHYAAPEVIRSEEYDGGQADVWSCGVILFVLLTGTPPFNYSDNGRDLRPLYHAIARADYIMPDWLSRDARDLIRKILVPDPKRRIKIDAIWEHPFLHKFDADFEMVGEKATKEYWVGPRPSISGWHPLERSAIDREILRYLRTLWHSEKEDVIIQRLMSKDPNQEKYFYSALQKYRDENLENYAPSPEHVVTYSNSDHHHHTKFPPTSQDLLQLPTPEHQRSQSAYSILNNEHLYSKHSFYEPPSSDISYDPFRASRQPVAPPGQTVHRNITVHRGSSHGSRGVRPATALGHRTGSSLRIQALKNTKNGVSRDSSKHSTPSQRSAGKRRSISRSSMASSHWPSSPPIVIRPGSLGKRGVSFPHMHRSSVTTFSTVEEVSAQYTPEPQPQKSLNRSHGSAASSARSSRPATAQPSSTRVVPKVAASPNVPRMRTRKPESPSKYIQSEARKVSTELEKVMEEAFNRSSIGSSVHTAATDRNMEASEYDTPPTSFFNRDSGGSTITTPKTKAMLQRPLPPVPDETPNTFLQRKLAETRADIARRRNEEGDNTEHFNEVLHHLDCLMLPSANGAKRTVSAPPRSPERPGLLQVIPEEMRADDNDRFELYRSHYRAVTDPVRPKLQGRRAVTEHTTVRLVDPSPTHIAPLNIRKRSGASNSSRGTDEGYAGSQRLLHPVRSYQDIKNNLLAARNSSLDITENKEATIKKKKSSWFRRNTDEKERQPELKHKPSSGRLQIPQAWQGLDDRLKDGPNADIAKHNTKQSNASASSEFPMRHCGTTGGKHDGGNRKGFFGLFSKKAKDDRGKGPMQLGAENFSSSTISGFDFEAGTGADAPGPPEVQQNWLSRFLHIKPANKVLCFQIGRGKVRQDLVYTLRDWQRFGVRDVTYNRNTNVINARIDKNNHLKIKPVSLVIELFVVLEHGRRANLCIARFTQIRGAASSFRKVVEIIEDISKARDVLVDDEVKKVAMCEILT